MEAEDIATNDEVEMAKADQVTTDIIAEAEDYIADELANKIPPDIDQAVDEDMVYAQVTDEITADVSDC